MSLSKYINLLIINKRFRQAQPDKPNPMTFQTASLFSITFSSPGFIFFCNLEDVDSLLMKPIFIILAICLSANTFAQQLNKKAEKLSLLIKLKYQNNESLYASIIDLNPDSYQQIMSIGKVGTFPKSNFIINTKNIKLAFPEIRQIDLSKQLRNIMHKFPGDGNNLHIDARGLKH